jgi:hypothetical protein
MIEVVQKPTPTIVNAKVVIHCKSRVQAGNVKDEEIDKLIPNWREQGQKFCEEELQGRVSMGRAEASEVFRCGMKYVLCRIFSDEYPEAVKQAVMILLTSNSIKL